MCAYVCSCCCEGTCAGGPCVGRPWTAVEREASWFTRLSSYVDPLHECVCARVHV